MLRYNELTCFYFILFAGALPLGPTTGKSGPSIAYMITVTESLLKVLRLCALKTHADFNCLALDLAFSYDCSKRSKVNVGY